MRLAPRVIQIIEQLYERNKALAHGTDDQRRELTLKIAQQTRFEFGLRWGTKRADQGRPPSKDSLAQEQSDGRLFGWGWQDGTTRKPNTMASPAREPDFQDITGQVFIEVGPINHLMKEPAPIPPSIPGPDQPIPDPPNGSVLIELIGIRRVLERIASHMGA